MESPRTPTTSHRHQRRCKDRGCPRTSRKRTQESRPRRVRSVGCEAARLALVTAGRNHHAGCCRPQSDEAPPLPVGKPLTDKLFLLPKRPVFCLRCLEEEQNCRPYVVWLALLSGRPDQEIRRPLVLRSVDRFRDPATTMKLRLFCFQDKRSKLPSPFIFSGTVHSSLAPDRPDSIRRIGLA
jgi:hypothetical protein